MHFHDTTLHFDRKSCYIEDHIVWPMDKYSILIKNDLHL